jgi:hypothetical protein
MLLEELDLSALLFVDVGLGPEEEILKGFHIIIIIILINPSQGCSLKSDSLPLK